MAVRVSVAKLLTLVNIIFQSLFWCMAVSVSVNAKTLEPDFYDSSESLNWDENKDCSYLEKNQIKCNSRVSESDRFSLRYIAMSSACQSEQKDLKCDQILKKDPGFSHRLRSCEPYRLCKESELKEFQLAQACYSALGAVTADFVKSAGGIWKCLSSAECYEKMFKTAVRGSLLATGKALRLMTPAGQAHYYFSGEQAQDVAKIKNGLSAAKQWLTKQNIRWQCYDQQTNAEMMCYAALSVLGVEEAALQKLLGFGAKEIAEHIGKIKRSQKVSPLKMGTKIDLLQGEVVGVVRSVTGMPKNTRIEVVQLPNGDKVHHLVEDLKSGKTIRQEIVFDELTGTIDANSAGGKKLMQQMLNDYGDKAHLAFIDVGDLGRVNNRFAKGAEWGDQYLKAVTKEIQDVVGDGATVYRLGGDEFGLIIREKDPEKVKLLLEKIQTQVAKSKDVHEIFRQEKIAWANESRPVIAGIKNEVREGRMTQSEADTKINAITKKIREELAPYSQQSVSVGSVTTKNGVSVADALEVAEENVRTGKKELKEARGQDATKYGGTKPKFDGTQKVDLLFRPKVATPAQLSAKAEANIAASRRRFLNDDALSDLEKAKKIELVRGEEKWAEGSKRVVEYKRTDGEKFLMVEDYDHLDPKTGLPLIREMPIHEKTGKIDAGHDQGRKIFENAVSGGSSQNRGVLVMKANYLGKVNYFEGGTVNGDKLLQSFSDIASKVAPNGALEIKPRGSEFVIVVNNTNPAELEILTKKFYAEVKNSPQVQEVYQSQLKVVRSKIAELEKAPKTDTETVSNLLDYKDQEKNLTEYLKNPGMAKATMVKPKDNVESIFSRTLKVLEDQEKANAARQIK